LHVFLGEGVGGRGLAFPRAAVQPRPVPAEFLQRLEEWKDNHWRPAVFMGGHECEFCETEPAHDGANFFVPGSVRGRWFRKPCIFVMPRLAMHYMTAHGYCPPQEFIDAVMRCPPMGSKKFLAKVYAVWPRERGS
jgi:hypothetical protein